MTEEGRALLTEAEQEIIAGDRDVSDNYEYKVRSLVRNRVRKKLGSDIDILEEHFPEVYEMVKRDVCDSPETDLQSVREAYQGLQGAFERSDPEAARRAADRIGEALGENDE
ncbi:hypothetical protein SAMN06269185_3300 [Natronoarchaeum philippinense]|uniref:Uncharacterized protein n=1 Tax=Natronoarchaeum philippinense TaxID=558529 RepID=A0A285P908_NATPI|nr:hypothetical protein [Natronoarchaeum philippinense]SNZ18225.1 hypothetical protein SAMN06269185_3300 [Natronoarchaeum philippinense]